MKALWTLLLSLLSLPPALAADAADPSGTYTGFGGGDLALMVSGKKAVAVYWGEHLTAGDRSCSCQYSFEKGTDGSWRSTAGDGVTMRLDAGGIEIEDNELGCCGSGAPRPSARYSDGKPPETCQVVGSKVRQLLPGATVAAVQVPDWAGFDESSPSGPQHLVRAGASHASVLLFVPDSELKCASSKRRLTLAEAHASALALFKAGKPLEAAYALRKGTGPKPWTITQNNLVAFNDFGFFLEQGKSYREAIDVLGLVIAAFPDRAVAHLNLGDAYAGLGDAVKAKAAYKRYVELMERSGKGKTPERVRKLVQE